MRTHPGLCLVEYERFFNSVIVWKAVRAGVLTRCRWVGGGE